MKDLVSKRSAIFTSEKPAILDWFPAILLFAICFSFFDQYLDMALTMMHADDFLECLFSGKVTHFYNYVFEKSAQGLYISGGDETTTSALYNIFVYVFMAIGDLPLFILRKIAGVTIRPNGYEIWGKIYISFLSVLSFHILKKLLALISNVKRLNPWIVYYFATSPLLIFCVIVRAQYDMIAVIFIMLALYYLFKKNMLLFSLMFSMAICVKMIPILFFIPILLVAEKKLSRILLNFVVAVTPYIITSSLSYVLDPGYSKVQAIYASRVSYTGRFLKSQLFSDFSAISVFLLLYVFLCFFAYAVKPTKEKFASFVFLVGGLATCDFFVFVEWHPQWLLHLVLFSTLLVFTMKDMKLGMLMEICTVVGAFVVTLCYHITCEVLFVYNPINDIFSALGLPLSVPFTVFAASALAFYAVATVGIIRQPKDSGLFSEECCQTIPRGYFFARTAVLLVVILPSAIYYAFLSLA